MTWTVEGEPTAVAEATRLLADDPSAVDALLHATDQLADDPRPAGSRPWGADHRRLRHDRWRVLDRVDVPERVVHIDHIGRVLQ